VNPEPIAEALFELVKDAGPVEYATRYRLGAEQLPVSPALVMGFAGASVRQEHNFPARWTLSFDIGFLARQDGSESSPESMLNEWIVALQEALAPVGEPVLTLGGLVDHAWLVGEVDYVPPSSQDPWMQCWVSVEVVAIG
jgi:hypothetical protein